MIALDNSSPQRHFTGETDFDAIVAGEAIDSGDAILPPAVFAEALSDPRMFPADEERLMTIPLLEVLPGFWYRAGMLRRFLHVQGIHAKLPDVLIAQSCIDHDVPLITYDRHFRHFESAGLQLV